MNNTLTDRCVNKPNLTHACLLYTSMTLPMSLALDKELTFKTVFRYRHIYPMAIDAVASGLSLIHIC